MGAFLIFTFMCTKIITDKNFQGMGFIYKHQCNKPEYKDGLCKHHYERKLEKSIPFKDRENYFEPSLEELKSGKLLHLKHLGAHGGFKFKKGKIYSFSSEKETNYPIDTSLFVILKYNV